MVGSCFAKTEPKAESCRNSTTSRSAESGDSWVKYALSFKYILSSIFYITLTIRTTSFPSWLYPWLRWTFSVLEQSGKFERNPCDKRTQTDFNFGKTNRENLRLSCFRLAYLSNSLPNPRLSLATVFEKIAFVIPVPKVETPLSHFFRTHHF